MFHTIKEKYNKYFKRISNLPYAFRQNWSIGIYCGTSPLKLFPINNNDRPVLTAQDVKDIPAIFVADPFIIQDEQKFFMFFEVYNSESHKGEISYASSNNGFEWKYEKCILKEKYHMSYPYVFRWKNEYYMIPETHQDRSVRLYKADKFPTDWTCKTILLKGTFIDSSILYYNNIWWLFTNESDSVLSIFYSKELEGPWHKHPGNPVIKDNKLFARLAGRIVEYNNKLYRYAQDVAHEYGKQIYLFEIIELSEFVYKEKLISKEPILKPSGKGWNSSGMHNIDPLPLNSDEFIACVDGWSELIRVKYPLWKKMVSKINQNNFFRNRILFFIMSFIKH